MENHGSREISSSDCSDDPQYIENNENRICVEHPEVNRESKTSFDGQGIEMTLLSGSSSLDPQSLNNSGMVLKDLFEPGASAATSAQCHSFDQRSSDYRFNNSIFSMEVCTFICLHMHFVFWISFEFVPWACRMFLFQHVLLA